MLRRTAASLALLTSAACGPKASSDDVQSSTQTATSEAGSDAEGSTGSETGPVDNCGLVGSNSQLVDGQCICDSGFDWCDPDDAENLLCCEPGNTVSTGDGDGDSTSGDGDGDSTFGDGDGDSTSGDGDGDSTSGDGDGDSTSGDGDGDGCQLSDVMSESDWDAMFLHKDDQACSGTGYTFPGFLAAASDYPSFACDGDLQVRRREVAAFLAQISHETTGGWATAPDGPHSWGLCFIEEVGCDGGGCTQYCDAGNTTYPCASGKTYHGRGAIQLSWNYNYGQAGDALGVDLLANPEMVANDPQLAIQTALWFWMTEQLPKPSAHDVMVGNWTPSASDTAAGRVPGFGMTTNIINGGLECGFATPAAVEDRVGFFNRYAPMLSTTVGDNLYCDTMSSF